MFSTIWARCILALSLVVPLCGVGHIAPAHASSKIVVYSAWDEPNLDFLIKTFAPTGIEVEKLVLEAAGTMAARVRSEADRPRGDILIGGSIEIHESLVQDDLLLSYRSPEEESGVIPKQFVDPRGLWHGFFAGPIAIMVNPRLYEAEIQPKDGPFPRGWEDLVHPTYEQSLAIWSPATVGGGYIFLVAQLARQGGEEPGFEWLRRLDRNVRVYAPTGASSIPFVARGEAVAGIGWMDQAMAAKDQGQPIEVILPSEAMGEIGGISIIKGDPNSEDAKRFIDLVYTKQVQEALASWGLYPVRTDVEVRSDLPALSELNFIQYDRRWAGENRERLLKEWDARIYSQRQ